MESEILINLFKFSPVVGAFFVFWFYQRKDFKEFVEGVQQDNKKREQLLNETIQRNQEIISNLSLNNNRLEKIEKDIEDIKENI